MFFSSQQPARASLAVVNLVLLIVLLFSFGINQIILGKIYKNLGLSNNPISKIAGALGSGGGSGVALSGDISQDAIKLAMAQGTPEIYGAELAVSFDQVEPAMNVMKQFDPTYGSQKIVLAGQDLQRYINIGLKIACEYCCGATSLIREDGQAACGCAHSQAMRGLLAYLIKNHNSEYTDDEMLRELARWKGLYFPKQMIQKITSQLQGANFTPDVASLLLGMKLPDYGKGSQSAPLPSDIKGLPNMVGGC